VNALGKAISIVLYAAAVIATYLTAPDATTPVALIGIAAFFAIHLALRARNPRSRSTRDR
jgi:hypothetical protein